MDDLIQRIADHVANEGTAGVLAVLAKRLGCRVRDIDRKLVALGCPRSDRELQDEAREMLQRKLTFHLPRQIAHARIEQLDHRPMGERDTPLQNVDPRDVLHSWSETLPDGVARSTRPPARDKRQR